MKRRKTLKKSEVLREGYARGLRQGMSVINDMIDAAEYGYDLNESWMYDQLDEGLLSQFGAGVKGAWDKIKGNKSKRDEEQKEVDEYARKEKSWDAAAKSAKSGKEYANAKAGKEEAAWEKRNAKKNMTGRLSGAWDAAKSAFSSQRGADKKEAAAQKEAKAKAKAEKAAAKAAAAAEKAAKKAAAAAAKADKKAHAAAEKYVNTIMSKGNSIAALVLQGLNDQFAAANG